MLIALARLLKPKKKTKIIYKVNTNKCTEPCNSNEHINSMWKVLFAETISLLTGHRLFLLRFC